MQSVLITDKLWNWFFNTSVGVSVIMVIYGFLQLTGLAVIHQSGNRLDATLGNAIYLAVYLLVHIFITALLLWKFRTKKIYPYVYGVVIICQAIILFYTGTRGTVVALIGGLIVVTLLLALFEKQNKKLRTGAIGGLILLCVLVAGFQFVKHTQYVQHQRVLSRLAAISLADLAPRLTIWKMALVGFTHKPLLGYGQENFNYVFNTYYQPSMYNQEQWFDRAHNVFLDWLVAGGILGLLSYLALFCAALWYIWKKSSKFDHYERILLTGLFVAYFVHNLSVFDNLVSYMLFFTMLAYIHTRSEANEIRIFEDFKPHQDIRNYLLIPGIVILSIGGVYIMTLKPLAASQDLIQALIPQQKGPAENLMYFKKAIAFNTTGLQETREQLVTYSESILNAKIDQAVKQDFYNSTRSELNKQLLQSPNDARAYYFAGIFLNHVGVIEDAKTYLTKAYELSPKKQTIAFELGVSYINLGQYDQALKLYKEAYESAPKYKEAKIFYATALLYAGDISTAQKMLATMDEVDYAADPRITNGLIVAKQYAWLEKLYKNALLRNPEDAQTHLSLSALYLEMKNRPAAIKEIQMVIDHNPSFKTQGEYYIKEIQAGRNP